MAKFLIIQTAFIGDVILATPVIEKINSNFPGSRIDFMLRKGNESLFENHPFLGKIYVWDKKDEKYSKLFALLKEIRKEQYDYVINLQRFLATGVLTALSKGKVKIGFNKNPLSVFFTKRYPHIIDLERGNSHEIDRNLSLLNSVIKNNDRYLPRLYPSQTDLENIPQTSYITISPTSVWFTKQYPAKNWIGLINEVPQKYTVYLLGGKGDFDACEAIRESCVNKEHVVNLAGKLSFLQSASYMKSAMMNYVNDSAPLHIASSMGAPVTAVFCSTTPRFGFGPLHSNSRVAEADPEPPCKPCGLHGYKVCPLGHFKCSDIDPKIVLGNI
jgi:heptosyltransferase-2